MENFIRFTIMEDKGKKVLTSDLEIRINKKRNAIYKVIFRGG